MSSVVEVEVCNNAEEAVVTREDKFSGVVRAREVSNIPEN